MLPCIPWIGPPSRLPCPTGPLLRKEHRTCDLAPENLGKGTINPYAMRSGAGQGRLRASSRLQLPSPQPSPGGRGSLDLAIMSAMGVSASWSLPGIM